MEEKNRTAKFRKSRVRVILYTKSKHTNEEPVQSTVAKKDGDWYIYPQSLAHENHKIAHGIKTHRKVL